MCDCRKNDRGYIHDYSAYRQDHHRTLASVVADFETPTVAGVRDNYAIRYPQYNAYVSDDLIAEVIKAQVKRRAQEKA